MPILEALCVSMVSATVSVPTAVKCSAPQCHPAVHIGQTWAHEGAGVTIQIVNMDVVNRLIDRGWQWVGVRDDQPLWVCLTRPKK